MRLIALIMIPAMVAGILAGLRVRDDIRDAQVFTRIEHLATLGDGLANLVQELEDERDSMAQNLMAAGREQDDTLSKQRADTDRAVVIVRGLIGDIGNSYSPLVRAKVRDLRYRLGSLAGLRELAGQTNASATSAIAVYSQLISALLDFNDLISQGSPDAELAESTRSFAALARAKDLASQERAMATVVLLAGGFSTPAERDLLQTTRSQQDSQLTVFRSTATTAQRQFFDDTVTGPEIGQIEALFQQILIASGNSPTLGVRSQLNARSAQSWRTATTARLENMRKVEQRISASLVSDSRGLKDDAWRAGFTDAAVLLVGLLLAICATVIVARSLVRPLRRLRDGALEVASSRLPGLVERLRDPQAAAAGIEVEPVQINSSDEIGEVARAFDEVHREAVRLASNEAMLRGNVNAMFVNLSRRSQSLIERQLRLIDDLEQGEQDDKRLASLFRLDHLATRMRRNCENLLVLGGQEQVRRWNQPVPLVDIVRASLSEVEQYDRVGVRVQGDVSVIGPVVNDLIHLVAELVENATVFSAEHTKVTISGHMLSGGGAMLQITDNGVGMTAEELEAANWRLANPPVVDVSVARRMGLFVVGRLAGRHGIRVELRAALSGGITAFALLPARAVASDENQSARRRQLDMVPEVPAINSARPPAAIGSGAGDRQAIGRRRWDDQPSLSPSAPSDYDGHRDPFQPPVQPDFPARPQPDYAAPVQADYGAPAQADYPAPAQADYAAPGQADYPAPVQPDTRTAPQPIVGRQPGAQPDFSGTGPQAGYGGPAAAHPDFGGAGAQPEFGRPAGPPRPLGRPTGSQPAVPPDRDRGMAPQAEEMPSWEAQPGGVSWDDGPPPAELPKRQERSPIFDAMESEWFQRRTTPAADTAPPVWSSPADEGWQAAEIVRQPNSGGRTSAGLPKRVPGKNRVPGAVHAASAAAAPAAAPSAAPPPPQTPPQSADTIRNRFASFQQGVHRGRAQATNPDDSSRTGETP
ncbi:sensor histidine kinase [Actinomadura alba]|uniref:sensor histidine kinase n=1 Tax=Actinomadura alba TaxID=406431 RepID=UPI001C9CCC63|nr:nitrate- and nitrite sensing domain-containing protein [Actinomadura alba]